MADGKEGRVRLIFSRADRNLHSTLYSRTSTPNLELDDVIGSVHDFLMNVLELSGSDVDRHPGNINAAPHGHAGVAVLVKNNSCQQCRLYFYWGKGGSLCEIIGRRRKERQGEAQGFTSPIIQA